jgi:hypothetical protein
MLDAELRWATANNQLFLAELRDQQITAPDVPAVKQNPSATVGASFALMTGCVAFTLVKRKERS